MRAIEGDIWDLHGFGYPIVVPTNIGWKKSGDAVMGRGIAEACAQRFPATCTHWGAVCQTMMEKTTVLFDEQHNLFYFPTKPLDTASPHLSWKGKADVELVKRSLAHLIKLVDQLGFRHVVTPLVGCGNGGLAPKDIKPIMEKNLDDRFILIRPCFTSSPSKPKTSAPSQPSNSSWTTWGSY